jgi:hypothetical protein
LVRQTASETLEPEELEQFVHAGLDFSRRGLSDLETEGDVVEHAHRLEERIALEHEADVALLDGHIVDAFTADEQVSGGGNLQPCDHAQHGGLAATARSKQCHEFAIGDRQ